MFVCVYIRAATITVKSEDLRKKVKQKRKREAQTKRTLYAYSDRQV